MNINDLFKEIFSGEKINSESAIILDIYSVIKIMDFYNDYMMTDEQKRLNQYTSTLLIVVMNFVIYEIMQYTNGKMDDENNSKINKNLRYAVHQFRRNNFKYRDNCLKEKMGISIEEENPMLDCILYFIKDDKGKKFVGTNIWEEYVIQNNFNKDLTYQQYTNMLMNFFRTIHTFLLENGLKDDNYKLKKIDKKHCKIIAQTYSFVSLIRKSKIKEEKMIRRLLIGFSQLATIDTMFKELIDIEDNEIKDSYIIYFFNKVTAFVLDETLDNIQSYINNTKDSETKEKLEDILFILKKANCEKNKKLRNNFHYGKQDKVFDNKDEMVIYLKQNLKYIEKIMNQIIKILNIKDRKITFAFFRLLAWTEYGYEADK